MGEISATPAYVYGPEAQQSPSGSAKTSIDMQGWKEKLLRRTKSQTTVDAYMKGVKRFEQFCNERFGLSSERVIDEMKGGRLDQYDVLDRFVG